MVNWLEVSNCKDGFLVSPLKIHRPQINNPLAIGNLKEKVTVKNHWKEIATFGGGTQPC